MTFKNFQHKHSSFYQQNSWCPVPDNLRPDHYLFIVIYPLVGHLIIVAIGNCVLGIVLQFGIRFVGSFLPALSVLQTIAFFITWCFYDGSFCIIVISGVMEQYIEMYWSFIGIAYLPK
jgi:hypothetical protein